MMALRIGRQYLRDDSGVSPVFEPVRRPCIAEKDYAPDADMREGRTDGEVAAEIVDGVGCGVPREALLRERRLVEGVVGVEDRELVVDGAVLVEERLRQEGELGGVPGVGRVHAAEDDDAERDADVLRDLGRERREEGTERAATGAEVVLCQRDAMSARMGRCIERIGRTQSKQSENMPRPSLPFEPPNCRVCASVDCEMGERSSNRRTMRVNQAESRFAKQKIETPVRVGATN